jgi:hypothetical protein
VCTFGRHRDDHTPLHSSRDAAATRADYAQIVEERHNRFDVFPVALGVALRGRGRSCCCADNGVALAGVHLIDLIRRRGVRRSKTGRSAMHPMVLKALADEMASRRIARGLR